jgi:hypothetical protein
MAKKVLFSMLAGIFVMTMAGLASAEAPVLAFNDLQMQAQQQSADPEEQYSNPESWMVREPVETGSIPSEQGTSSDLRCCAGDSGPILDREGDTVLRPGIDDGP